MRNLLVLFATISLLAACGGGDGGGNSNGSSGSTPPPSPGPNPSVSPTPSPTPSPDQFAVDSVSINSGDQIQTTDSITIDFNAEINLNSVYYNSSDPSLDSVRVVDVDSGTNRSINVSVSGNSLTISAVDGWRGLRMYRVELTQELSSTETVNNALLGGYQLSFSTDIRAITGDTARFVMCNNNYNETEVYEVEFQNTSGSILSTEQSFVSAMSPVDPIEHPCANTFDGYVVEAQSLSIPGVSGFLSPGMEFRARVRYRVFPNMPVTVVGDRREIPSVLWSGFSGMVDLKYGN